MRLLTCISTKDRPWLLDNAIRSFELLFRHGDLLIVDDASTHEGQSAVLEAAEGSGHRVHRRKRASDAFHGGLYDGLNEAVEIAVGLGYDTLQLVQDDMQFMWHDPTLESRLDAAFADSTVAQVSAIFFKGVLRRAMPNRVEPLPGIGYRVTGYGMTDTGFVPLDLIRRHDFRFRSTENDVSSFWRGRGFGVIALHAPFVAWVPFPLQLAADERRPVEELFLRPLDGDQRSALVARSPFDLPFHEDWCLPWGWSCLAPYWFTRLGSEYVALLRSSGETRLPRYVGDGRSRFRVPDPVRLALRLPRAAARRGRHYARRGSEWDTDTE